jgi:VanZ family protein
MLKFEVLRWAPPALWMVAIFWFSTDEFSAPQTGLVLEWLLGWISPGLTGAQIDLIHFLIRKAAHFTAYAILAVLLFRAFRAGSPQRWRWQWFVYSFLVIAGYALFDEYHQSYTAHRTASIHDSLLDMLGGLMTLVVIWLVGEERWGQFSRSMRSD